MTRQSPLIVPERGVPLTAETVVVPVEPTEAMINAYFDTCARHGFRAHINATAAWSAMLSAAPAREPEGGVVDAFDHIHRLAAEFNPEMHDIDQVLSEINQIALASLTPKEAPAAFHNRFGAPAGPVPPKRHPAATGAGERERIIAFLKERDEACGVIEADDDERAESADLILALRAAGCAELEVGRAVYERIEKLIDATTGPDAEELSYLAHLAASVEEVGGYDGPEAPPSQPLAEGADAERLRVAVEGIEAARRQINDGQAEAAHYNLGATLAALQQEGR